MKKILLVVIMFASLGAFSQIKKLESKNTRISSVPGAHIELKEGNTYEFYFKDLSSELNEFVYFQFRGPKTSDFNDIKGLITGSFSTAVEDEIIKFKSNEDIVAMKFTNQNGIVVVQLMTYHKGAVQTSRTFTLEEINLLFTK